MPGIDVPHNLLPVSDIMVQVCCIIIIAEPVKAYVRRKILVHV